MIELFARNWWALALRGAFAVLFGLLTFLVPGITLLVLVTLYGAYALLDGIFNIVWARHAASHRGILIIEGIFGIVVGIVTFVWPGITAIVLLFLIAFWAIVTGVLEIAAGFRLRQHIRNAWLIIIAGIVSLLFGLFILISPGAGALAILYWIGAYALVFGVLLITLAFWLRGHRAPVSH